ncbi:hypothetical protein QQF64_023713 [Cirrhinus molitorella]|uniref:Uncharacterized protein n=1 Tax=Cirrhinus molitorella TaxID=172907 RepID=A0ABR3NJD6_9TELE
MKKTLFSPGRVKVSFRKGPSGHLRRDPSEEAKRIKDNPSPQDKSTPQREDLVEEEEQAGQFNPDGPCKDSLISFLEYSRSFKEIEDLKRYLSQSPGPVPVLIEDDNTVGFGTRAQETWRKIWDTRADGYAFFIMKQKCVPGSKMYKLQQYLLKLQQKQLETNIPPLSSPSASTARPPVPSSTASDQPVMEEDEELERMMLSLSPTKYLTQLSEIICSHGIHSLSPSMPSSQTDGSVPSRAAKSAPTAPSSMPSAQTEAPVPSYLQDISRWNCSLHQRIWMKTEMESIWALARITPSKTPHEYGLLVALSTSARAYRDKHWPSIIQILPAPSLFHLET